MYKIWEFPYYNGSRQIRTKNVRPYTYGEGVWWQKDGKALDPEYGRLACACGMRCSFVASVACSFSPGRVRLWPWFNAKCALDRVCGGWGMVRFGYLRLGDGLAPVVAPL